MALTMSLTVKATTCIKKDMEIEIEAICEGEDGDSKVVSIATQFRFCYC